MYGKAWSSLGRLLDPITQDACAFYEDHALFDDYTGVVYETSEGDRIAQALGKSKAVILRNHGLLTVGQTIDEAVWWFITMDRSCQAQLLAEAAGKPIKIAHEHAVTARESGGQRVTAAGSSSNPYGTRSRAKSPTCSNSLRGACRECASPSSPTSTATGSRLRQSWRICAKPLPT